MPIRDAVIILFFIVSIPIAFRNPVHGVLLYALVAYLNPHRLAWGLAHLPLSFAIAGCTIIGFFFYKQDKRLPITREIICIALLWLLATLGWFHAFNPRGFEYEWKRFTKILIMILVTTSLIKTKKDIRYLYLIMIYSIGFYDLKGVIWFIRGGTGMLTGPPSTFFWANNGLGMVFNMMWPLSLVMARLEDNKWHRRILWLLFLITPLAIVATDSRASALTMGATLVVIFITEKRKLILIFVAILILAASFPFIREKWVERMGTISNYEADASAMGRINAWHAGWNIAMDRPLTGGGMMAFTRDTIYRYAPEPENFHDVHSIYFEVLGEIGFPGLFIFLALLAFTFLSLLWIDRRSKSLPDGKFYSSLAKGTFIGLVAYMVNGIFLGLAFFDLFYQFVGLTVSLKTILINEIASENKDKISLSSLGNLS